MKSGHFVKSVARHTAALPQPAGLDGDDRAGHSVDRNHDQVSGDVMAVEVQDALQGIKVAARIRDQVDPWTKRGKARRVVLALVRTCCGLLKCVAQHAVHEMFAFVGAKCTPGGTRSDLDGGPYGRCRPPRRARKFVDESGRTREAEARYNLSQDDEAV